MKEGGSMPSSFCLREFYFLGKFFGVEALDVV